MSDNAIDIHDRFMTSLYTDYYYTVNANHDVNATTVNEQLNSRCNTELIRYE